MIYNNDPQIDELLSGYIDSRLSKRERTEVKRLLEHDHAVAARFKWLQKQTRLLNSLPVEPAPQNLLQTVGQSLDKDLLLHELHGWDTSAGAKHLMMRRVVTAAAMIVLIAVLAAVVLNIVTPANVFNRPVVRETSVQPKTTLTTPPPVLTDDLAKPSEGRPAAAFNIALQLTSSDAIAVNAFLKKAIYNTGLVDCTVPNRHNTTSTYHITCGALHMGVLIGELEALWDRCDSTTLIVYGPTMTSQVVVNNVTAAEVGAVLNTESQDSRIQIAENFAGFNAIAQSIPGTDIFGSVTIDDRILPPLFEPIKPILTSGEKAPPDTARNDRTGKISLTISVKGL